MYFNLFQNLRFCVEEYFFNALSNGQRYMISYGNQILTKDLVFTNEIKDKRIGYRCLTVDIVDPVNDKNTVIEREPQRVFATTFMLEKNKFIVLEKTLKNQTESYRISLRVVGNIVRKQNTEILNTLIDDAFSTINMSKFVFSRRSREDIVLKNQQWFAKDFLPLTIDHFNSNFFSTSEQFEDVYQVVGNYTNIGLFCFDMVSAQTWLLLKNDDKDSTVSLCSVANPFLISFSFTLVVAVDFSNAPSITALYCNSFDNRPCRILPNGDDVCFVGNASIQKIFDHATNCLHDSFSVYQTPTFLLGPNTIESMTEQIEPFIKDQNIVNLLFYSRSDPENLFVSKTLTKVCSKVVDHDVKTDTYSLADSEDNKILGAQYYGSENIVGKIVNVSFQNFNHLEIEQPCSSGLTGSLYSIVPSSINVIDILSMLVKRENLKTSQRKLALFSLVKGQSLDDFVKDRTSYHCEITKRELIVVSDLERPLTIDIVDDSKLVPKHWRQFLFDDTLSTILFGILFPAAV